MLMKAVMRELEDAKSEQRRRSLLKQFRHLLEEAGKTVHAAPSASSTVEHSQARARAKAGR
jgi:hypothetical protein